MIGERVIRLTKFFKWQRFRTFKYRIVNVSFAQGITSFLKPLSGLNRVPECLSFCDVEFFAYWRSKRYLRILDEMKPVDEIDKQNYLHSINNCNGKLSAERSTESSTNNVTTVTQDLVVGSYHRDVYLPMRLLHWGPLLPFAMWR